MKALVLAAGLGSRLKDKTKDIPKALVEIKNRPVIEYVLEKIVKSDIKEIFVNAYYHKDRLVNHLKQSKFAPYLKYSIEDSLLNTGGSLKKIKNELNGDDFLLYNTDVLCSVDIKKLINFHHKNKSLVTMVMQKRASNKLLPVDEDNRICGLKVVSEKKDNIITKPNGNTEDYAFCGIHLISNKIFDYCPNEDVFSIISWYLDIMKSNNNFFAYKLKDDDYWLDMGTPEKLIQAETEFNLWFKE